MIKIIATLFIFFALPVYAHSVPCLSRAAALKKLAEDYGEYRKSIGLGKNNVVMEIFASDETGTWTVTITTPDGRMCIIQSGYAFETIDEPQGEPG